MRLHALAALTLLVGCGGDAFAVGSPTTDSGASDGAATDSSASDTNEGDTSESDTSAGDASVGDASVGDASVGDTSAGDTSAGDASAGDANAGDATGADSRVPDASGGGDGATDGGTVDAAKDTGTIGSDAVGVDTCLLGCPLAAPTIGSACGGCAGTCTYEPTCPVGTTKVAQAKYACAAGTWTDALSGPTCAPVVDAGQTCPSAEPARGASCSFYLQQCVYGDGSACHTYRCTHIGWSGPTVDCTPGCPATAPTNGTPCPSPGLLCLGYNDPRPGCGTDASCTTGGWKVAPPSMVCPLPP